MALAAYCVGLGFDMVSNNYIGAMCREFRECYTDCTQSDVARECGISREMVSKFERGIRPNTIAFLWYIRKGIFDWVPVVRWNGWLGAHSEKTEVD